ncbi:MAG TPA: cupredoxin domain-containing protein [Actinomycetota bacterium]|nr:cupredoxin domain-containing protein [Actinomycetota bacterium]
MKPFALAIATAFLLVACGGDGGGGDATNGGNGGDGTATGCIDVRRQVSPVVVAVDNEFDPSCLQVAEGQNLTVRNEGNAAHTFTIDEAEINVVVQPGEESVVDSVGDEVPVGGEVEFRCEFHPEMTGTLRRPS